MRRKIRVKRHRRKKRTGSSTVVKSHFRSIKAKRKLKANPYLLAVKPIPIKKIKPTEFVLDYESEEQARVIITEIMKAIYRGEKIQPIAVVPGENEYYIKDGHHRLMAFELMGINNIVAEIENPDAMSIQDLYLFKPPSMKQIGPLTYVEYWKTQADLFKAVGENRDERLRIPTKEQLEIINNFKKMKQKKITQWY
jgi:hypothetical protein